MIKQLTGYFVRGLVYLAPISFTLYVAYKIIMFLDGLLQFETPGASLIIVIMLITILGFVGSLIISSPIVSFFEKLLIKIPLVNILYTSIKDLVQAFAGEKNKFNIPVMVRFDKNMDVYKPGFVTQKDMSVIEMEGMIAVYLPHSYNFSGNVFLVPKDSVKQVNVPSVDFMKFIVSGGVSGLNK